MKNIPEHFGELVFSDAIMKERLPEDVYAAMKRTIVDGRSLNISIANVVADAMKDWAIEKGATHFTHWFQLYLPHRRRLHNYGVLGQGAYQGRV